MRLSAILLIVGLVALFGCRPDSPPGERSPGETLFRARCMTCHRLPKPQQKTEAEWADWLAGHRQKAGLNDTDLERILAYLSGPSGN